MSSTIWQPGTQAQYDWVEKFKQIFIQQHKHRLVDIFSDDFGMHNGLSLIDYVNYEFDEFKEKHDKFDLQLDAKIQVFQLEYNFIYFSLGNATDKAVFEALFQWTDSEQKVIGNQYPFKIEPKIQFFSSQQISKRRINITPLKDLKLINVIPQVIFDDCLLIKNELPAYLGGNFYSFIYEKEEENHQTFWDYISFATNQGIMKKPVLMRGEDHPLFLDNLFPHVTSESSFTISEQIFPVIINILFTDGSEEFFKYPLNKIFQFNKKIKKICLTDSLSFDWIVDL